MAKELGLKEIPSGEGSLTSDDGDPAARLIEEWLEHQRPPNGQSDESSIDLQSERVDKVLDLTTESVWTSAKSLL